MSASRRQLLFRVFDLGVVLVVLVGCDLAFEGLSLTSTGLVLCALVIALPDLLLNRLSTWLGRHRNVRGAAPARFLVVTGTILSPFWLLPLAAALSDGIDLSAGAWFVTAALLVAVTFAVELPVAMRIFAPDE